MGFADLLINRCSWKRPTNTGVDVDGYNEITTTDLLIASDVPCSRQVGPGLNMRQQIQDSPVGQMNKKIAFMYVLPTDIQEGDKLFMDNSEIAIVRDVRDAAGRGHHYEIVMEEVDPIGEGDKRIG